MGTLSEEVVERTRGTPHAMRKPKIEPLPEGANVSRDRSREPSPRHVPVKKLKGNRPKRVERESQARNRPKPVATNRREESEDDEAEPSSRARVAGGHKVWQEGSDKLNMQVFKGKFPWRAPHVETNCPLGIHCPLGRATARRRPWVRCWAGRLALGGAAHSRGATVPLRAQREAEATRLGQSCVFFNLSRSFHQARLLSCGADGPAGRGLRARPRAPPRDARGLAGTRRRRLALASELRVRRCLGLATRLGCAPRLDAGPTGRRRGGERLSGWRRRRRRLGRLAESQGGGRLGGGGGRRGRGGSARSGRLGLGAES